MLEYIRELTPKPSMVAQARIPALLEAHAEGSRVLAHPRQTDKTLPPNKTFLKVLGTQLNLKALSLISSTTTKKIKKQQDQLVSNCSYQLWADHYP